MSQIPAEFRQYSSYLSISNALKNTDPIVSNVMRNCFLMFIQDMNDGSLSPQAVSYIRQIESTTSPMADNAQEVTKKFADDLYLKLSTQFQNGQLRNEMPKQFFMCAQIYSTLDDDESIQREKTCKVASVKIKKMLEKAGAGAKHENNPSSGGPPVFTPPGNNNAGPPVFTPPSNNNAGGPPVFTPPSNNNAGGPPVFTPPGNNNAGGPPVFTPPSKNDAGPPVFTPPGNNNAGPPVFTPPSKNDAGPPLFTPPSKNDAGPPLFTPPSKNDAGGPPVFTPPSKNDAGPPVFTPPSKNNAGGPPVFTPPGNNNAGPPKFTPNAPSAGPPKFTPNAPSAGPPKFTPNAPSAGPPKFTPNAPSAGPPKFTPNAPSAGPPKFTPNAPQFAKQNDNILDSYGISLISEYPMIENQEKKLKIQSFLQEALLKLNKNDPIHALELLQGALLTWQNGTSK